MYKRQPATLREEQEQVKGEGQRAPPVGIQSGPIGAERTGKTRVEPGPMGREGSQGGGPSAWWGRAFSWLQLDKHGLCSLTGGELPIFRVTETEPRGTCIGVVFQRSD